VTVDELLKGLSIIVEGGGRKKEGTEGEREREKGDK
jgi:hypothetical protein